MAVNIAKLRVASLEEIFAERQNHRDSIHISYKPDGCFISAIHFWQMTTWPNNFDRSAVDRQICAKT